MTLPVPKLVEMINCLSDWLEKRHANIREELYEENAPFYGREDEFSEDEILEFFKTIDLSLYHDISIKEGIYKGDNDG